MIKLTLANNSEVLINTSQIDKVLPSEPSVIILKDGKKIEVKESLMTIINLIKAISYRNNNNPQ